MVYVLHLAVALAIAGVGMESLLLINAMIKSGSYFLLTFCVFMLVVSFASIANVARIAAQAKLKCPFLSLMAKIGNVIWRVR